MAQSTAEPQDMKRLRETLKEIRISERKLVREKLFEKTRFALGEFSASEVFSPEDVSNFAIELKKKTLSVKHYRDLQNALLQSEENINAFLSVNKILPSLLRDLSSNHAQMQIIAASCCCNIALGNSKACMSLAKTCISNLITELDSMNSPLVEVCVWSLGNLVIGNDKVIDFLIPQECMKLLTKLVNHHDELVRSAVFYTLIRFLFVGHRLIPEADIVQLAQTINLRSKYLKDIEDVWLLALLSSNSHCIEYLIQYSADAVVYLHEILNDEDYNVSEITMLIRLLGNLVNESSGQVAELLLNNTSFTIESLLTKLLMHSYVHVRKETLWLIGNMYTHSQPKIVNRISETLPSLTNLPHAIASIKSEC